MQTQQNVAATPVSVSEMEKETLQKLRRRIVDSGVLGRSPVYQQLLDYLLACARSGKQPKEFEIAVDVLGRDSSFDVTRDSVVRVYIHQLRKRLDEYFSQIDPHARYRLSIPKGQYTVNLSTASSATETTGGAGQPPLYKRPASIGFAIAVLLLLANIWQWQHSRSTALPIASEQVLQHPLWQSLADDDLPILIIMGDYYIFGETDETGRVTRMVRDFFINSSDDLTDLLMQDSSLQSRFRDLDMNYLPEGSASALMQIAPIVAATGKRADIRMMSRVSTADMRNHHVIYIGYVSAMDKLHNIYFPSSGLTPGRTYDELYNKEQQIFYTSNAGLPGQGQAFRDLALLATWPAAGGNQFILVSGTRDAGLMHAANVISSIAELRALSEAEGLLSDNSDPGYEAVYEVYGMDRMNFEGSLLYHQRLDPERIWHH